MAQPYTPLENTIIRTKKNIERLEKALNYIKEWSEKYTKWDIIINVKGKIQACPIVQVLMNVKGKTSNYIEMHYLTSKEVFKLCGLRYPDNLRYGTDEWRLLSKPTKDCILDNELLDIYLDIVGNGRDVSYSAKMIKTYQNKKTIEQDFKCRKRKSKNI